MKNVDLLVIIPARSGSKGITNKNLVKLRGKPLVYYSLKTKINVNKRIICSTDSSKIKEESIKLGINVPFLRPKNICSKFQGY